MTTEEIKQACDEHYTKWLQNREDGRDCYSAGWLDCIKWLNAVGLTEVEVEESEGEG